MVSQGKSGRSRRRCPTDQQALHRKEIIRQLENARQSSVITFILGDRRPAGAQIAEDSIRPLYDHLAAAEDRLNETGKVDLFIFSRGGRVEIPWRIVSMFREFAEEFNVLIPFKAYSAATLIALGADHVVMSRKGELGPIDPSLERTRIEKDVPVHEEISTEDVMSYLTFIKRVGISDQEALAQSLRPLAEQLTALTLGNVERMSAHIRIVARKLLESHQEPLGEDKVINIIDTLVERMYFHGHGISRREASQLRLPIESATSETEKLMWDLYREYEDYLQLLVPIDPRTVFPNDKADEHWIRGNCCGIIESVNLTHCFLEDLQFQRIRDIPQLTLNLNLPIQLPPNITPGNIPPNLPQQLLQQLLPQIQQQVREAMVAQSTVRGVTFNRLNCQWTLVP